MKGCFITLFLALITALVAGFFGKTRHHERVERLLTERTAAISESFPEVTVQYDHFTAKVSGRATRDQFEALRRSFEELRLGNGRVSYDVEIVEPAPPPPLRPSNFSISIEDDKLTLRGEVDSEQTREVLGRALRGGGMNVENLLAVSGEVEPFPSFGAAVEAIPPLFRTAKNPGLEADPRRIVVSGTVVSEQEKKRILDLFSAEKWDGAVLEDRLEVKPPPPIPPSLTWKKSKDGGVSLSGRVPDAATRDALLRAAGNVAGTGGTVADEIRVADRVENRPWLSAFPGFAVRFLGRLEESEIRMGPADSSIAGRITDSGAMNELVLAFSGIDPPGKLDVDIEVVAPEPPAMTRGSSPRIEVSGEGDRLVVTGMVPSKEAHDQIINSILGMKGIEKLDDRLRISEEVKEAAWLGPMAAFIQNFYNGSVKNRQFTLSGDKLVLRGTVPSELAKTQTLELAGELKERGVTIVDEIAIDEAMVAMADGPGRGKGMPPGDGSGENGNAMAAAGPGERGAPGNRRPPIEPVNPEDGQLYQVFFGTGEFHIRTEEMPRAARILDRAKATGGKIVIDGFADERGDSEVNDYLSNERANRVRQYLIRNGVDENRIVSVTGRGEISGGKYPKFRRADVRILE